MDKRVEAVARSLGEYVYERNGNPLKWDDMNDSKQEVARCYARCALKAAHAAAWQPIESAPHGVMLKLAWKDKYGEWKYSFDKASWDWKLGDYRSGVSRHGRATHWQPLPVPPSDATP